MMSPLARYGGLAAILLVVVGLVFLAVSLDELRKPAPLTYRLDWTRRGLPLKTVTVYVVQPDSLILLPVTREMRSEESRAMVARNLIASMTLPVDEALPPLPAGTELLHFFETDTGDAVLDFNAAVMKIEANGILEEKLRLEAVVRTLADNLGGLRRFELLVHGRPLTRWGQHVTLAGPVEASQ